MLIYFILGLLVMGLKVWFYYKYRPQKLADWIEWGRDLLIELVCTPGLSLFTVIFCQWIFWPLSMIIIPIIRWVGDKVQNAIGNFIDNLNKN